MLALFSHHLQMTSSRSCYQGSDLILILVIGIGTTRHQQMLQLWWGDTSFTGTIQLAAWFLSRIPKV